MVKSIIILKPNILNKTSKNNYSLFQKSIHLLKYLLNLNQLIKKTTLKLCSINTSVQTMKFI